MSPSAVGVEYRIQIVRNKIQGNTTIALGDSSNKKEREYIVQIQVICTCGDYHLYTNPLDGSMQDKDKRK